MKNINKIIEAFDGKPLLSVYPNKDKYIARYAERLKKEYQEYYDAIEALKLWITPMI